MKSNIIILLLCLFSVSLFAQQPIQNSNAEGLEATFTTPAFAQFNSGGTGEFVGTLDATSTPNQLNTYFNFNPSNIQVGDIIFSGDGRMYEIIAVNSASGLVANVDVNMVNAPSGVTFPIAPAGTVNVARPDPLCGTIAQSVIIGIGLSPTLEAYIQNYNTKRLANCTSSSSGGEEFCTETITQTAHGLSAQDLVHEDNGSGWVTSTGTADLPTALVLSVPDANSFIIATCGIHTDPFGNADGTYFYQEDGSTPTTTASANVTLQAYVDEGSYIIVNPMLGFGAGNSANSHVAVVTTDGTTIDFTQSGTDNQTITAEISGFSTATNGQVPTADGAGGLTWTAAAGGASLSAFRDLAGNRTDDIAIDAYRDGWTGFGTLTPRSGDKLEIAGGSLTIDLQATNNQSLRMYRDLAGAFPGNTLPFGELGYASNTRGGLGFLGRTSGANSTPAVKLEGLNDSNSSSPKFQFKAYRTNGDGLFSGNNNRIWEEHINGDASLGTEEILSRSYVWGAGMRLGINSTDVNIAALEVEAVAQPTSSDVFRAIDINAVEAFLVRRDGEILHGTHSQTRDDSGTEAPLSFHYPSNTGQLLTAPITLINGGFGVPREITASTTYTATDNRSTVYIDDASDAVATVYSLNASPANGDKVKVFLINFGDGSNQVDGGTITINNGSTTFTFADINMSYVEFEYLQSENSWFIIDQG